MITQNLKAFLDMIAFSELGAEVLAESDNGYNVIVGSLPGRVDTFPHYNDHPRKLVHFDNGTPPSTAAGRYQLLAKWFDAYKKILHLPDFSPASQDAIAIQQIKECKAIDNINAGFFTIAVAECSHIWASLPGAGYGQHENKMEMLRQAYVDAGGTVTFNA